MSQEKSQLEIITEGKKTFIDQIQGFMADIKNNNSAEGFACADVTAKHILGLIDGNGDDTGYILIPREEGLAMMPATKECWDQCNGSGEFKIGLDISGGLVDLFDGINS